MKSAIKPKTPTKPNSSAKTANVKSVWASGKKKNLDWLNPIPSPKKPPFLKATKDCIV